METIIQIIFGVLFFLTPLLMASNTSELFEFNKQIFIYCGAVLIAALWAVRMIQARRIIFRHTWLTIPLLAFLLVSIASLMVSIDQHTSLWGYYGRFNGGVISLIAYIVLYFAFVSNITKKSAMRLLYVSVASSLAVILWGLPGKFGYDMSCLLFTGQMNNSCWTDQFRPAERMFSTLGQPNWLGAYLAVNLFIGLYLLFKQEAVNRAQQRVCLGIYVVLNFISILYTRSRSALVAVAFGAVAFVAYMAYHRKTYASELKTIGLGLVLSLILVTFAAKTGVQRVDDIIALPQKLFVKSSMQSAPKNTSLPSQPIYKSDITESLDIRKIVWKGAIELAKRYPLLGTGPETFAYSYYFVRPIEHNATTEWDYLYNKAHNEYLNYLATTGFGGLAAYAAVIVTSIAVFLYAMRKKSSTAFLSFCLFVGYSTILVTNFFGFSTTTINLLFYLLPAFVLVMEDPSQKKKEPEHTPMTMFHKSAVAAVAVLGILGVFYFLQYWYADTLYKQGDDFAKANDFQSSASLLSQARTLRFEHVYDDKLAYVLANLAYVEAYQKQNDKAVTYMQAANAYNLESLHASPKNVLYWKTRAKISYLFFQTTNNAQFLTQGIEALKKAQEYSPTDPKIPYSLSIFYSFLYDTEKNSQAKITDAANSIQMIDLALNLKPDYKDSYMLKAQLQKKYGNNKEAKDLYQYVLEHFDAKDKDAQEGVKSL